MSSLFDATCRTVLAPYLPRGLTLAPQYADLTPAALAVAWSYFPDHGDRRVWCFPFGGALHGLCRERFQVVCDALSRHFDSIGRGMEWMATASERSSG